MSKFQLTYEQYEQTLRKAGLPPVSRELFDNPDWHDLITLMYGLIVQRLNILFERDLQVLDQQPDDAADGGAR